jgi:hypothetical protein
VSLTAINQYIGLPTLLNSGTQTNVLMNVNMAHPYGRKNGLLHVTATTLVRHSLQGLRISCLIETTETCVVAGLILLVLPLVVIRH